MKRVRRRSFLKGGASLAWAGALPLALSRRSFAAGRPALVPDPDGILDLAEGFSYTIIERQGDPMSDGYRVPGLPDGMGCFPRADGRIVLMRNHELSGITTIGPYYDGQATSDAAYDAGTHGGVTRVVLDGTTLERESSNLVLVGTTRNCAGGVSPWGWLTCEESIDAVHGYVFLCSTEAETVAAPQRITGYGHFYHEAATVDPATHVAYLTEDRVDGCFFRFVPEHPSVPFVGRLQALGVAGRPGFTTATGLTVGDTLDVTWFDLPDPDPADDSLRTTANELGAAIMSRGEGIWHSNGIIYITATNGGDAGVGQIFALDPTVDGGQLVLVAQSDGVGTMDGPDNVLMAPWGDLLITEDSVTGRIQNRLLGLTPEGELYTLAQTSLSELSGLCFTPDGKKVFLNVFGAGITLVISGPFGSGGGSTTGSGGAGMGGASGDDGDAGATAAGEGAQPGAAGAAGADEPPPHQEGPRTVEPSGGCAVVGGEPAPGGALAVAAAVGAAVTLVERAGLREPKPRN